jgi:S-adenosyl-L-methionine hydrolase (adenosine-forming)
VSRSAPTSSPAPIVTLTTDFGLRDAYVGAMKGTILGICPFALVIDIGHMVSPQNVHEGAFLLRSAYPYFPDGSIHCAVVDPGVGTSRRAVAIRTERATLVGPDNGIFTHVLTQEGMVDDDGLLVAGGAVELQAEEYRLPAVSNTFHGRDIFAPAAAHLAAGVPLRNLGPPIDKLVLLDLSAARLTPSGVRGQIIHIDRFGNAISNIGAEMIPAEARILAGDAYVVGLSRSYEEADVVALAGSLGLLEIAVRHGNAAERFGLQLGDTVQVTW